MNPGAASQGSSQGRLPPSLETRERPPLGDRSQPHRQHPCRPTSTRTQGPRLSRLRLPDFGGWLCGRRSLGSSGGGGLSSLIGKAEARPLLGLRASSEELASQLSSSSTAVGIEDWKALASGTMLGCARSPARGLSGRVMTASSPGSFLGREPEAGMAEPCI